MKPLAFVVAAFLLLVAQPCPAQPPKQVAGILLGGNISDYKDRLDMQSALPIRYQEYLTEVELNKLDGFKSGLITYATCDAPGLIVRIKLKYADSSKRFFEDLLKRYKQKFGEPSEWRGDPFHVMLSWKWSFVDPRLGLISMTLQHNSLDEEEKVGNSLKMTLTEQLASERRCFEKKSPPDPVNASRKKKQAQQKGVDWDRFVPR